LVKSNLADRNSLDWRVSAIHVSPARWLLDYHLKRPKRFVYVMIVPILEIFLYLYPVTVTADIISNVLQNSLDNLTQQLLFLLGFALFQASVFYSINFLNETLAHRVTTDITEDLFIAVQEKSLRYHDTIDIGQIMSRATGDTRTINKALSPGIVRTIQLFTIWILAFYISTQINIILVMMTIVAFVLYLLSLYIYAKGRIEISRKVLQNYANLTELSLRSVSGIREIKNFTAEEVTSGNFSALNDDHINSLIREGEANAWFYPALIATFYSTAMIASSVYLTYLQVISFRQLLLVTGVILFLRVFSSGLKWQSRMIIAAIAASRRVYNIIHEEDPQEINHGSLSLENKRASIEFDQVSFSYRPDLPLALENISFKINENQTIAIVGRPGSGKSTLTKLVQRLYLPNSGKILIGGESIEKYDRDQLRNFIATVEQDIFLFNRSILDNIRFGKPEATEEEVIHIAKVAQAHDFIMALPDGYATRVGEKGVRLSGGQQQRISIARALLMDPSILLMDDGASALDAKTELEIQRAISEILQTRTTVITTHRLSIIAKADLILILDDGQLVGKGSHEQLIRSNQYYRQLFEYHYELPPMEVS